MVKRHQVSPRALAQGIVGLELSKCRPVVALLQMRELVYEQVVEDPVRERGRPLCDSDCA